MLWQNEYHVADVYGDITLEELQEALPKQGAVFKVSDSLTNEWAAFGFYIANKNDLNEIYKASLANITAQFMTGMGFSAGTEAYLKEETIENKVIDKYNELQSNDDSEVEKIKKLIEYLINLYGDNGVEYEKAVFRVNAYLTFTEYEDFKSVEGASNRERIVNLMK